MDTNQPLQLTAPLVILATIWLGAGPVLSALRIIHGQRDIVLGVKRLDHLTPAQAHDIRSVALWNSYLPLLLGVLLFLLLLTGFVCVAVNYLELPQNQKSLRRLGYIVALQPAFTFIGFLLGGARDMVFMLHTLKQERHTRPATGATTDDDSDGGDTE